MKVVRFAETKPLPSYLLAFGVGRSSRPRRQCESRARPAGIVVTRGKTSWAKYSAQSSPKLMSILEAWFAFPTFTRSWT